MSSDFRIRLFLLQTPSLKDSIYFSLCRLLNQLIRKRSRDYIWHRDPPIFFPSIIRPVKSSVSSGSSTSNNNSNGTSVTAENHRLLVTRMQIGDALTDEWHAIQLVIECLREIATMTADDLSLEIKSAASSALLQAQDSDGEVFLFEAADVLEPWMSPDDTSNRVFLSLHGSIHIVSHSLMAPEVAGFSFSSLACGKDSDDKNNYSNGDDDDKDERPSYLDSSALTGVESACKFANIVRKDLMATMASPAICRTVSSRLQRCKEIAKENEHVAVCRLPHLAAIILAKEPSLVSLCVDAITSCDTQEMTRASMLKIFAPRNLPEKSSASSMVIEEEGAESHPPKLDMQSCSVRFSKAVFARLAHTFPGVLSSSPSSSSSSTSIGGIGAALHPPKRFKAAFSASSISDVPSNTRGLAITIGLELLASRRLLTSQSRPYVTERSRSKKEVGRGKEADKDEEVGKEVEEEDGRGEEEEEEAWVYYSDTPLRVLHRLLRKNNYVEEEMVTDKVSDETMVKSLRNDSDSWIFDLDEQDDAKRKVFDGEGGGGGGGGGGGKSDQVDDKDVLHMKKLLNSLSSFMDGSSSHEGVHGREQTEEEDFEEEEEVEEEEEEDDEEDDEENDEDEGHHGMQISTSKSSTSQPRTDGMKPLLSSSSVAASAVSTDEFMSVLLAATRALNLSSSSTDSFSKTPLFQNSSLSGKTVDNEDKEKMSKGVAQQRVSNGRRIDEHVVTVDDCMQAMDEELYGSGENGESGADNKGSLVGLSFSQLNEDDQDDDKEIEEEVEEEEDDEDDDELFGQSSPIQTHPKRAKKSDSSVVRGEGRGEGGLMSEVDARYNFVASMSSAVAAQRGSEGPASTLMTAGLQVDVPKEWWRL